VLLIRAVFLDRCYLVSDTPTETIRRHTLNLHLSIRDTPSIF
jgi:hypothetical protein